MAERLYLVSEQRYIDVPKFMSDAKCPKYVSKYFEDNLHQKPMISLDIYDWDLHTARTHVAAALDQQKLGLKAAATYLYHIAQTRTGKLADDWVSYEVIIGKAGAEITPLEIIDAKVTQCVENSLASGSQLSEADDHWLTIWVCGHYRLAQATIHGTNVAELQRKIHALMKAAGYKGFISLWKPSAFASNRAFGALISVMDMFWTKFKQDDFFDARIGTLVSRYQDCAILGSLDYLSKLVAMSTTDLLSWIFVKQVADEANLILKSPDETEQQDSYFPYLHGLMLTDKSPYSTKSSPNLHYWIHFIGCILNSKRSVNARVIEGANVCEIPKNCILVGYALKLPPAYASAAKEANDGADCNGAEPTERDPHAWLTWFSRNKFQCTPKMKYFIQCIQAKISNERCSSFGEEFKKHNFF